MERRKFVIGAGALATGSAAAMGTGAFSFAQISDREANIEVSGDDSALIQLLPGHHSTVAGAQSTVGENRVRQEDGQLMIDFDDSGSDFGNGSGTGVAPNSVYQVGALSQDFDNISYHGSGSLTDDILYGTAAGDTETEYDDPAFEIRNESDQRYDDVTIGWVGESAPAREKATAAMNVRGGGAGTAVFSLDLGPGTDHASFNLGPGESVSASLLVSTGDFDPESTENWMGDIVINVSDSGVGDRLQEPASDEPEEGQGETGES